MEATTTLARPRPPLRVEAVRAWLATAALGVILAGSLLVVVAAAQGRMKWLSPSIHPHAPGWLTWPFGGLWSSASTHQTSVEWLVLITLLVMTACYGLALWLASSLRPRVLWGAVAAVYLVFFLSPPLLLTDVFNYIGYARMGTLHGLNPYTQLPVAGPHDLVYGLSTWHHLRSPYGPLFSLLTYALVPLGVAGAYWTFKALLLAASLAALVLVARIARRLELPVAPSVVLVGLNPLVLLYGAGGQHMDMLLLVPLLGAIELALARRELTSGAAIATAAFVKASAVLMAPVFVAAAFGRRLRVVAGLAAGGALLGAATLIAFGPHLPNVSTQNRVVSPFSIPNVIGIAAGRGGQDAAVRTVMEVSLAVAVVACVAWAWRTRELLAPLGWVTVASLVTLSWDMAWYVLWLLPFIAFVRSRPFRIAAVAVCVWMTIQWLPLFPVGMHKIGLNPSSTATWHRNALEERRLVH